MRQGLDRLAGLSYYPALVVETMHRQVVLIYRPNLFDTREFSNISIFATCLDTKPANYRSCTVARFDSLVATAL